MGITKTITESKSLGQVQVSDSPQQEHSIPQVANPLLNDGTAELVKSLAGALSASRIPVPEPSIFSGDPLRYNDWKLSFHTLIGQRNIPENEKIFYLRRYMSGQVHWMDTSCLELSPPMLLHGKYSMKDICPQF